MCFSGTLLGVIIICAFGYQQNVGFVKKHGCHNEILASSFNLFVVFGGWIFFFSSDNWNQRFGSKHPAYNGVERYLHAAFFKSLLVLDSHSDLS